jgi:tRNAThr (cytosine32-N3)-methyltransferase
MFLDELAILFTGSRVLPTQEKEDSIGISEAADIQTESNANVYISDHSPASCLTALSHTPSQEPPNTTSSILPPSTTGSIHPNLLSASNRPPQCLFAIKKLGVDRRLQVNRKRQLKMYRVWMQGTFFKIGASVT